MTGPTLVSDYNQIFDSGGSLSAISASPDRKHYVAAGREVLKIVSLSDEDGLKLVQNLRFRAMNLNYSGNDVAWHPMKLYSNLIATAATNGAVVVWNLDMNSTHKYELVICEHNRTVNSINWHPTHGHTLISGSQDGTMKLWLFDMRKQTPRMRITAHQGLVLWLDWHPEEKSLLASGGRDRMIKVWNLDDPAKPISSIETISSVSCIRWQPTLSNRISSTSGLIDYKIHIWDVKSSYIPIASFAGHTNVVTRMTWHNAETVLSCSKDHTLRINKVSSAYRHHQHINTVSLAWDPANRLTACTDLIDRNDPVKCLRKDEEDSEAYRVSALASLFSITGIPAPKSSDKHILTVFSSEHSGRKKEFGSVKLGLDMFIFRYIAENYELSGNLQECAAHNARVASDVKQSQTAFLWKFIGRTFEHEDISDSKDIPFQHPQPLFSMFPTISPLSDYSYCVHGLTGSDTPNFNASLSADSVTLLKPIETSFSLVDSSQQPDDMMIGSSTGGNSGSSGKNEVPSITLYETALVTTLSKMAEHGDVQTCVSVALVLKDKLKLPDTLIRQWFHGYIELLRRHQLWNQATNIICLSKGKIMESHSNQASTTVHAGCPYCGKPLFQSWYCRNCTKLTGVCSICHLPVHGVYVWCQGCGHGGHLDHMTKWFSTEKYCPTGCNHICDFRARS